MAARRGLRGYSLLIQEALARYLGFPEPARPDESTRTAGGEGLLAFLCDGFSTGRCDGSARHDDYIYRGR